MNAILDPFGADADHAIPSCHNRGVRMAFVMFRAVANASIPLTDGQSVVIRPGSHIYQVGHRAALYRISTVGVQNYGTSGEYGITYTVEPSEVVGSSDGEIPMAMISGGMRTETSAPATAVVHTRAFVPSSRQYFMVGSQTTGSGIDDDNFDPGQSTADPGVPATHWAGSCAPEHAMVPGMSSAHISYGPEWDPNNPNPFVYEKPKTYGDQGNTQTLHQHTSLPWIEVGVVGGNATVQVEIVCHYAVACTTVTQAQAFGRLEEDYELPHTFFSYGGFTAGHVGNSMESARRDGIDRAGTYIPGSPYVTPHGQSASNRLAATSAESKKDSRQWYDSITDYVAPAKLIEDVVKGKSFTDVVSDVTQSFTRGLGVAEKVLPYIETLAGILA